MRTLNILFFCILLARCVNNSEGKRDFVIELTHGNCTGYNPLFFKRLTCRSYSNKALAYFFAELILKENVRAFLMRTSFDMLRKDNTRINLVRLDIDGCQFFEAAYSIPFTQFGLRELRRTSNFPKKCPLKAGIPYVVRNYTVNPEDYPPYTPAMTFIWKIKFMSNNVHQGDLVMYGKVKHV